MSSITLHFVLLFAIAYGQIFSGVSCCCLSRSVIARFSSVGQALGADRHPQTLAKTPHIPKCPRCAASQTSVTRSLNAKGVQKCIAAGSGECQCTKATCSAGIQPKPRPWSITLPYVATSVATVDLLLCAKRWSLRGYEVPLRLGWHSWQSIACVWKK